MSNYSVGQHVMVNTPYGFYPGVVVGTYEGRILVVWEDNEGKDHRGYFRPEYVIGLYSLN